MHTESRNFSSRNSSICAGQERYAQEYYIVYDGKNFETNFIILWIKILVYLHYEYYVAVKTDVEISGQQIEHN